MLRPWNISAIWKMALYEQGQYCNPKLPHILSLRLGSCMYIETLPYGSALYLCYWKGHTFKCISSCFVKEVLLITVIRDVSYAFLVYLAQRVDLEFEMLSSELMVSLSFMRREVDMADRLVSFDKDRSVLWDFVPPRTPESCRWVSNRSWYRRFWLEVVKPTATRWVE